MVADRVLRRSALVSFITGVTEVAAILALLYLCTELTTRHLTKVVPALIIVFIFTPITRAIFLRKWLSQTKAFDLISKSEQASDQLGPQALLAQEELVKYPLRASVLVFALWVIAGLVVSSTLLMNWGETFFLWEAAFIFLTTILGGTVALVLHFYAFRKIVRREAQTVIQFETGYHLSQAEAGLFKLRAKLRLSFMPIIFAGLAVLTALGFFQAALVIKKSYEQELTKLQANFIQSKPTLQQFQDQIEPLSRVLGVNIFLLDEQAADPLTGIRQKLSDRRKDSEKLIQTLQTSKEQIFSYRYNPRLVLILANLGVFDGKKVFLTMVYDWNKFLGLEYKMLAMMILIVALLIGLAVYILKLISDDLLEPLQRMMEQTQQVSRGDLSADFNIFSDDELGVLSGRLKGMVLNLRELLERVRASYDQVRTVINEIMTSSDMVAKGAQEQSLAIGDTSQNIGHVNQAVKEVSDNTEILHNSGQETMQRSEEMIRLGDDVNLSLEELEKAIEVSSSSILEMSTTIKQIASNAEELNHRSEKTSQAVIEMQKSIGQVADSSRQSREISERMRKSAEQGVKAVQETIQGISTIEDTVSQARTTLENLSKSTDQIGKILKVIREVANRTNLLALNAAIIAAQAGEQGQGFAVVADEIKNLADRVASSTVEIDQIIKKVQEDTLKVISVMEKSYQQVETGVNLSYEAGMALERIMKSVEQSFGMASAISQATDQQVQSAQSASAEISGIAELIQQIAVSTREQSKGADQMAKAGADIKKFTEVVLARSKKQSDEAQKVQVAMENVEQMIKFILDSQRGQAEATERIVAAINRVRNIALRNAESVTELDKHIAILNQQSEVLKGVLKQFQISIIEEGGEREV